MHIRFQTPVSSHVGVVGVVRGQGRRTSHDSLHYGWAAEGTRRGEEVGEGQKAETSRPSEEVGDARV
eukprot:325148-Hanusia_phi.AAC.1